MRPQVHKDSGCFPRASGDRGLHDPVDLVTRSKSSSVRVRRPITCSGRAAWIIRPDAGHSRHGRSGIGRSEGMRPITLARLLAPALLVCAALVLSAPPARAASTCANATLVPSPANLAQIHAATLCLLNEQRTSNGRAPLALNRHLDKAAKRYSLLMVRKRFFSHLSPQGSTLTSRVRKGTSYLKGSRSWALSENIGWGSGRLAAPAVTVDAWMRSSRHRANILTPGFRDVGVGVAPGAPRSANGASATYTIDFGRRS